MNVRVDLKQRLLARYGALLRRLEYMVGSRDGAADALQETWIRLDSMPETATVANPDAYLLGVASRVVVDQYRREQRHVHEEEIDELFESPDDVDNPERIVAARRTVDTLKVILEELPPRQRAILWAARVEGKLNRDIAEGFGISIRMVEKELSNALKYCSARMKEQAEPSEIITKGRRKS
ncbi:MAG TPA: RNA polymerase sigma factor [Paraburkholderia sp.]|jgi:RNA polymerase sigma-70 factor (ECF subfamily)